MKSIDQTAKITATISDFMTTRIAAIRPSSSVQEVAKKMTDRDVCSLIGMIEIVKYYV
jgi:predicted transcriptional regulator